MALVNVAAELTRRGRRVLLIDFDLEAPGIPSFPQFSAAEQSPGIVDYVAQYMETSAAPSVSDFIVQAELLGDDRSDPIWILPAGKKDEAYGQKLSSIDWQDLYEHRSGYLLFEDLKQQLQADPRGFDYVLVDSRTGHTDVGGICTRQLADVVAFMFFPNSQNISGLQNIVEEIRNDRNSRRKAAKFLFCPSNVPDLDDEYGILRLKLDEAKDKLRYEQPDCTIRHYNSLSLVDQRIFVIDRPRTKLAGEYRALTSSLVRMNFEDKDGALFALQRIRSQIEGKTKGITEGQQGLPTASVDELLLDLERIAVIHSRDGEISWKVASIYHLLGNLPNELEALNGALEAGYEKAHLSRGINLLSQSKPEEARLDFLAVIDSDETTGFELSTAIQALKTMDPNWVEALERSPALEKLQPSDVSLVSDVLMSDVKALGIAHRLIAKAVRETNEDQNQSGKALSNDLLLLLIATGHFAEALQATRRSREEILEETAITTVFNYAMAEWGETGAPSWDLFEHVLELNNKDAAIFEANYTQCLALANAVVGNIDEAFSYLEKSKALVGPGTVFSCWRYLYGGRSMMLQDLKEMEMAFTLRNITPPFLDRRITLTRQMTAGLH